MKRHAGFTTQVTVIAVIVALALLAAAVAGGIHLVNVHDEEIRSTADKAGYDRASKEAAQRDKAELEAAQAQITQLQALVRAEAEAHTLAQADAKRKHDEEVANAKAETEKLRADVRTGRLVLRDPGARARPGSSGQCGTGGAAPSSQAATPTAPAAGGEQAGAGVFSVQTSEFLLSEADRADEVAADLKLCWSIARNDRKALRELVAPTPSQ